MQSQPVDLAPAREPAAPVAATPPLIRFTDAEPGVATAVLALVLSGFTPGSNWQIGASAPNEAEG